MGAVIQKRWLSKVEAAEYLGVSTATIRRLTQDGKLHPSRTTDSINKGEPRWDVRDLDAYMERKIKLTGTPPPRGDHAKASRDAKAKRAKKARR